MTSIETKLPPMGLSLADKKEAVGLRQLEAALGEKNAEIIDLQNDTRLKRKMSKFIRRLATYWVGMIFTILLLVGFEVINLSDSVVIAFLATTTTSMIGLPAIVLRGIFSPSISSKKIKEKT